MLTLLSNKIPPQVGEYGDAVGDYNYVDVDRHVLSYGFPYLWCSIEKKITRKHRQFTLAKCKHVTPGLQTFVTFTIRRNSKSESLFLRQVSSQVIKISSYSLNVTKVSWTFSRDVLLQTSYLKPLPVLTSRLLAKLSAHATFSCKAWE